ETYASLFMDVIYREAPEIYQRIRRAPITPLPAEAERVYALSRVTLGADVAVTSVLMDAAKRRYPNAPIVFVGPRKNYEMFAADPRVSHMDAPYARGGSLRSRLEASGSLWIEDGLVLDPDSLITQLGLIQVAPDEQYCFFESRSYGKDSLDRLPDLAARWMGDPQASPYIAPLPAEGEPVDITVSLGVGENLSKRVSDEFETELMRLLASTGRSVLVDLGGSPAERERVERALQPGMQTHSGAFAPFAAQIARSKLFVGYDSAAGHVASACGVPLISIATGFATERMAARWKPLGTVLRGDQPGLLEAVRRALPF
ncbi:MAG: hypothetical protein RL328_2514, partial [Acidobacteriota bacterium]